MIEVVGVDSHIATVAACAVDAAGRELCSREFANDPSGHAAFAAWIAEHRPQGCRIGVEGALGFAFALVEHLLAEGLEVVEVPAHLTRRETRHLRGQGRSDPRDALAIARVTLREHKLAALRPAGANRALKLVHDYRRQLTVERSRTANRLHADLHSLYPGYRVRIPNLMRVRHLAAAARLLRGDERVQASLARRRLAQLRRLDREIHELRRELTELVAATHTGLVELCGVGPLVAARILGEVGDIRRFANKDAFAAGNGTAPIPASSGARHRYRLNRGGNRRLNDALHVMCLTQMRIDPRARAYIARRRAEGKSTAEAMRSLKRHLSDVIYNQLQADLRATLQSPQLP
jgi:transposase